MNLFIVTSDQFNGFNSPFLNKKDLTEPQNVCSVCIIFRAVKQLITINHIQNKSLFTCVCTVYVYVNTHTRMVFVYI